MEFRLSMMYFVVPGPLYTLKVKITQPLNAR
jgi:hypothetical protein